MNVSEILQAFAATAEKNQCEILSIYVSGSYANGYYLEGISDLDLLVLVDRAPEDFLEQLLRSVSSTVELDLCVLETSTLYNEADSIKVRECVMSSKLCGKLLWGADLLETWKLPPVEKYVQQTLEMVLEFIHRAHGDTCNLRRLTYPNPDDLYLGYLVKRNGELSTKQLISLYTWIATARLARDYKLFCGCKKACLELSVQYLSRSFTDILQEVYDSCRKEWKYTLPKRPRDCQKLQKYCHILLEYEQAFVDEYLLSD